MGLFWQAGKKAFDLLPESIKPTAKHFIFYAGHRARSLLLHDGRDLPASVEIETISDCNRKCRECPRPTDRKEVLPYGTFVRVVEDLRDWNFRGRLSFHSYNEPLLDERIYGLVEIARDNLPEARFVFYTNGDYLTQGVVDTLLQAGTDKFMVSLHDPASDELVSRISGLERAYEEIVVLDLRKEHRKTPLVNRGGLLDLDRVVRPFNCYRIGDPGVVRANGDVTVCCNDALGKHPYGNVNETSFREIWESEDFRRVRKLIRRGRFGDPRVPDICAKCGYEDLRHAVA